MDEIFVRCLCRVVAVEIDVVSEYQEASVVVAVDQVSTVSQSVSLYVLRPKSDDHTHTHSGTTAFIHPFVCKCVSSLRRTTRMSSSRVIEASQCERAVRFVWYVEA